MKTQLPEKSLVILPILQDFQKELLKIYGDNLQGIILFGSYSRGDFNAESDVDLLLLFNENFKYFQKDNEVYSKIVDILSDYNLLISLIPTSKYLFEVKKAPLYMNVKKEGIELWKR
jgi:predicted nucleotidyltransferase